MSGTPYIMKKGVSRLEDVRGGLAARGLGIGNIYYVVKSSEAFFDQFLADHQGTYGDNSAIVHPDDGAGSGIATALTATVANRNDYVIVNPSESDYDLTATLTLNKKAVHLIAPAGFGYSVGACNAVRLEQTGAYPIMTVSGSAVEIAGFYLKNKAAYGGIQISNSTYGLNIHHNYFAMYMSDGGEPLLGPLSTNTSGNAGAWSTISNNFFQSQSGANATLASCVGRFNTQSTGVRIVDNDIAVGDTNNTFTSAINNLSTKGIVSDNDFYAHQTPSGAGVITTCVTVHSSGCAFGNRGGVGDGALVTGGTNEISFVLNYNAVGGGAQDEDS